MRGIAAGTLLLASLALAVTPRSDAEIEANVELRLEGNAEATCRFLGLNLQQFYRRCARLGLRLRSERKRHGLPETRRRN